MGEIYVDPPDYSIINPVSAGVANLSLVVPLAHAQPYRGAARRLLRGARSAQLRHLAPRLERRAPGGPLMADGAAGLSRGRAARGGVASWRRRGRFYDPFTGEGLYTALRGAELLAEVAHAALRRATCSRGALAPYARARHAAFRGKARLTRMLQAVIAHRRLADLAAHALARRPRAARPDAGRARRLRAPGALLRPSI